MKYSSLAEFYKDRSLFVTGATGFMGKVDNQNYLCLESELLIISYAAGYDREIFALVPWRRVNLFVDEIQKRSAAKGSTRGPPGQPG